MRGRKERNRMRSIKRGSRITMPNRVTEDNNSLSVERETLLSVEFGCDTRTPTITPASSLAWKGRREPHFAKPKMTS